MDLNEALDKLKKAGFICEDTDTDDDEYWAAYNKQKLNKKAFDYANRNDSYGHKRANRSLDFKIILGRLYNLANKLEAAGIDVGELNKTFDVDEDPQLPVSVSGTVDGETVAAVACWGDGYVITDDIGTVLKELKTDDAVVDFLAGLN